MDHENKNGAAASVGKNHRYEDTQRRCRDRNAAVGITTRPPTRIGDSPVV
jgi:hypothetical protein